MFDAASKAFFHTLARSRSLQSLASRYGMASPTSFARRFIAGETVAEAIAAARAVQARGMFLTLDYLGESVTNAGEAASATREYVQMLGTIVASGIERNISLKLTQLGLDIDRATAVDNLRRILDPAERDRFFVRVDMENSPYTDVTLDIVETLWQQGYRNIGTVLQSCLHRTEADARRLNGLGIRVRLVKGAYKEPKSVAYQSKAEVDANYVRVMQVLLEHGPSAAIATHDPAIIDAMKGHARQRGIATDRYEFQMLYGIRRDLQAQLVTEGYRLRVYIPFGQQWFPYFMRRLGERPANIAFVIRGILGER